MAGILFREPFIFIQLYTLALCCTELTSLLCTFCIHALGPEVLGGRWSGVRLSGLKLPHGIGN